MSTVYSVNKFYAGLSGLALPIPKYKYPESFQNSSRLNYYASQFNSIEINRSFYALPNGKTVAKWANDVPENFTFTFKLWKQITHAKNLQFEQSDVRSFIQAIDHVGPKKGSLLIQFPASIKSNRFIALENLLEVIQANNENYSWKVAVEFRDASWYIPETLELLESYRATLVLHDKSKVSAPLIDPSGPHVYVRFHGPGGNYRGTYTDAFLYEYADYICEWLLEGRFVFVYFNNTMGTAYHDLTKLNSYVVALLRERATSENESNRESMNNPVL